MFELEMTVRDYECDLQGIVNNAVYQNYFEHARHEFLNSKGISFSAFASKGIFLVAYRAEIDYLSPLKSNNSFTVDVSIERISKVSCSFEQNIKNGNLIYAKGKFLATAIDGSGKPLNLDLININALFG